MAALPARHKGRPTPDWIRTAFSSPGLHLRTFPFGRVYTRVYFLAAGVAALF